MLACTSMSNHMPEVAEPVNGHHEQVFCNPLQVSSGAWQQLRENLALAKSKKPQELGVDGAVPPDHMAIEKIRHKFLNMRKMYSPEKKVSLLLRICKLIYTIMQDNSGKKSRIQICRTGLNFSFASST